MGRRYLSEDYARVVRRVREAIPGVAIHGDAIVGFPTEDAGAWARSLDFIRSIGFAGLHAFRYSARPGTAATRMQGQVDEWTKKARASELLAVIADARAAWAAARRGSVADVLFETRLDDGRWVGHAADHTMVGCPAGEDGGDLENAIGRVVIDAIDVDRRDRVIGRILSLSPPPRIPLHAR
jgi:tRNA A37 methylthiotransferase MiaB